MAPRVVLQPRAYPGTECPYSPSHSPPDKTTSLGFYLRVHIATLSVAGLPPKFVDRQGYLAHEKLPPSQDPSRVLGGGCFP